MKRRVLVVDDEPPILITLELAFEDAGMAMEGAPSAEDAIERLQRSAFDAVLADKNLPGKSGIDLVRWIRERNRTVPLVVMTGYASPESAKEALNLGIDSYIEKPFPSVTEIPELLNALVESGRPGWLPGQSSMPVAMPSATRPARILLLAAFSQSATLGDPALAAAHPGSSVDVHESVNDVLTALESSPRPDLVIIDADQFPDIVLVVQAIRETSEFVSVAVVTSAAPPLSLLQELILLGVTQLLDRSHDAYETQVARVVRGLG